MLKAREKTLSSNWTKRNKTRVKIPLLISSRILRNAPHTNCGRNKTFKNSMSLRQKLDSQSFPNGYALVDGVAMHRENGERFQIPHDVLKRHIVPGYFVELRVDSDRFSVHPDAPEKCMCSTCNGEASKPILSHEQPASLVELPPQDVPSRGWGEDFWARVEDQEGEVFRATVDNPLYESRLHGISQGSEILFHADHILAVHPCHRQDMVLGMNEADLRELVEWLGQL